jgi:transposase InsO family protein
MAHFIPTNKTVTAVGVAKLYLDNVFRLHGLPKEWTTDWGPQFASQVIREIHKALSIKTSISTAYHPQSNGQTERINQELEAYIRHFVSHRQDDWSDLLATAEFALNNRRKSATDLSSFELNYGFSPHMDLTPSATKTLGAENCILPA